MYGLLILLSMPAIASLPDATPCSHLRSLIQSTYGFRPSLLDAPTREAKSRQMDAVWKTVEANPGPLVPCLRTILAERSQDSWFLFDGSQLLVSADPSRDSKLTLLNAMAQIPLDDVDLRTWVQMASSLGRDGFDTSELGRRWLSYPNAKYFLPEHGAYEVDRGNGAMFIFGAMDEQYATPTLSALCRTSSGQTKEIAAWLLMSQAAPEALRAITELDPGGLSESALASRKAILEHPALLEPKAPSKTSRDDLLKAFNAFLAGDDRPFARLVELVPDGERDVVAVCTTEDIELIRKVRRRYIARANQHAIEYYNVFSQILMTMVWRPELVSKKGG
jgi:hypothetical protein